MHVVLLGFYLVFVEFVFVCGVLGWGGGVCVCWCLWSGLVGNFFFFFVVPLIQVYFKQSRCASRHIQKVQHDCKVSICTIQANNHFSFYVELQGDAAEVWRVPVVVCI